jgi:quercetin dioxygenase-like cupin family protein
MKRSFAPSVTAIALVASLSISLAGCTSAPASQPTATPVATISAESLLAAAESTILDQPIAYPGELPAQVSSTILTVPPGAATGWHFHSAPMYAYILEGTLTVTYDVDGVTREKVYRAGDALLEAVGTHHNGMNNADVPVRVLVVNMGAAGVPNTTLVP